MTVNSTTSELMQDNSSTECVSSETNSTDTVQNNELIFGQKHNDIDCALCPTANRTCDRAWVTAKNLEEWSSMSTTTLWRWLGRLEKARRIATFSDMKKWQMPHEQGGSTPTTLYNLNVLNQLAMACIDNEKLNEVSCKFSDILSEVETTGSYSIRKNVNYPPSKRKPLAPTHKSKGFCFCRRQVHRGVEVSPTTKTLIKDLSC